ncbi:MAG: TIGR01777 family oxidoreductase [Thermodesulfobacteriota bacterium]
MKFFIMGGTGLIGRNLASYLLSQDHEVLVLTREGSENKINKEAIPVFGSGLKPGKWQEKAAECDTLINLLGKNIFCRWTPKAKKQILETRTVSTQMAVQALSERKKPAVFICANAVGYYGDRGDEPVDESASPGNDFLARVCVDWQKEALKAEALGHRVLVTRFAAVLAPGAGALEKMLPAFKWGVGGRLGSGKQWFPWVHIQDLVRALSFLALYPQISGIYNICSPEQVTNAEFTKTLASVLNRPAFLPFPAFMLRLILGELGSMLLSSQKCLPRELSSLGFSFKFPELKKALNDLI